jgi:hypothetical protein
LRACDHLHHGYHERKEKIMTEKIDGRKAYVKPDVRQIRLSLAELTLGTNCDINNQSVDNAACPPNAAVCNA